MNKALEAARTALPGLDWRGSAKDEATAAAPNIYQQARLILAHFPGSHLPWGATLVSPDWNGQGNGATPSSALANLRIALCGNPPEVLRRWIALGGDLEEWKP